MMTVLESTTKDRVSRLESNLRQRHRQVRQLRVTLRDNGVELYGEAPTYYLKQLVIRDVKAVNGLRIHANRIAVRSDEPATHLKNNSQILLAAGDEGVSRHYGEHLTEAGIQVESARTALACLKKLRVRLPDALVIVGHLPWGGVDGLLEVAGEIGYLDRLHTIFVGDASMLASLSSSIIKRIAFVPFPSRSTRMSHRFFSAGIPASAMHRA